MHVVLDKTDIKILQCDSFIQCFQLKAAEIVPPVVVYKQIISSLENWTENPTASVEPYTAMRRAYPAKQPDPCKTNLEYSLKF